MGKTFRREKSYGFDDEYYDYRSSKKKKQTNKKVNHRNKEVNLEDNPSENSYYAQSGKNSIHNR